jgi:hypothetical protein
MSNWQESNKIKRFMVFAIVAAILTSCAGLPTPEGKHGCLVIGNIMLDFPDGFFSESARTIKNGIRMRFTDLDENKSFAVYTSNGGYFFFAAKPGHQYRLESWGVTISDAFTTFNLGPNKYIVPFNYESGKILYLQHIGITHNVPKQKGERGNNTIWNYVTSITVSSKPYEVHDFIKAAEENSGWLDYDIEDIKVASK